MWSWRGCVVTVLCVVCAFGVPFADGFRDGAGSCGSPEEGHEGGFVEDDGSFQLSIVTPQPLVTGESVLLKLAGQSGKAFRGFQVISEYGSFLDSGFSGGVKLNMRHCEFDGRVTHTSSVQKGSVMIPFQVPDKPGFYSFTYYVVEERFRWFGPLTIAYQVVELISHTPSVNGHTLTPVQSPSAPQASDDIMVDPPTPQEELEKNDTAPPKLVVEPVEAPQEDAKKQTEEVQQEAQAPEGVTEEEIEEETNENKVTAFLQNVFSGKCTPSKIKGYECMDKVTDFFSIHWTVGKNATAASGGDATRNLLQNDASKVPGEGEVLFGIEGITGGWVSIAFPEVVGKMDPADAIIGWVKDGFPIIRSYRITGKDIRPEDVDETIEFRPVGASEEQGKTFIEFIKVADGGNVVFDINEELILNFAIGEKDELVEHPPHGKGSARLNLLSGRVRRVKSDQDVDYMVHGALLVIGWVFFVPLGITVARHRWAPASFGKGGWIDIHRVTHLFAIICTITAVVIGLCTFEDIHSSRGRTHVVFATFTLIGLLVQVNLGMFRPKPDASKRWLFNTVHSWVGRLLAILAFITVFMGIGALKMKLQVDVTGWVASVILISLFHLILAFSAEMGLQKKRKGGEIKRAGEVDMTGYSRGLEDDDGNIAEPEAPSIPQQTL